MRSGNKGQNHDIKARFFSLTLIVPPLSITLWTIQTEPILSSPQQWAVKRRSSQVTKAHYTYTHCPHSANSFCLLENKKAHFGAQPAPRNNPLGEWEITDWSYLLSLMERKSILHFSFCCRSSSTLQYSCMWGEEKQRNKSNNDLTVLL